MLQTLRGREGEREGGREREREEEEEREGDGARGQRGRERGRGREGGRERDKSLDGGNPNLMMPFTHAAALKAALAETPMRTCSCCYTLLLHSVVCTTASQGLYALRQLRPLQEGENASTSCGCGEEIIEGGDGHFVDDAWIPRVEASP